MVSVKQAQKVPVWICILVKCVVPILVSSHGNNDLNFSNNLSSDCFISGERLCKGGLKGIWLNFFIHHFLSDDIVNRCLWHVVSGWLYMPYALSFVEGDMFFWCNLQWGCVVLICLLCHKYHWLHGCLGSSLLLCVLIADEVCYMWSLKLCPLISIDMACHWCLSAGFPL